MTNFERIKNMSIEEMAVTLMCPNEMGMANIECDREDNRNCCQCILDWLKKEEKQDEEDGGVQKCRVCGCTWYHACPGGCYWVEEDLCSACVDKEER